MKETIYMKNDLVILNFSKEYLNNNQEIVNSKGFYLLVNKYLQNLENHNPQLFSQIIGCTTIDMLSVELVKLTRLLLVFGLDEIDHPLIRQRDLLLYLVEDIYNYWRKIQRFSILYAGSGKDIQLVNFIESDSKFNSLIINFYRTIQEKVIGHKNHIYRQLHAGTNGSIVLRDYHIDVPSGYEKLRKIPFIDSIMMRTPLILTPKSNKREGSFVEVFENPINTWDYDSDKWMIYPCYVGASLCFLYFDRDYLSSVVALSNLFELASDIDCIKQQPDLVVIFGNKDDLDQNVFYQDKANDMIIASLSHSPKIEYFGYLKKICLTLHNVRMINKKQLPLHGAMVKVTFKNGITKGMVLIGDSGAGKSETIETIQQVASEQIANIDIIFDDMGTLNIVDGKIKACGTEIGAFVRLDDLDKGSAYKDMDRSIFFNPSSINSRVVLPVATYQLIREYHDVDMFLYANNYTDTDGLRRFDNIEEAKQTFINGFRNAKGTTDEKGLTNTFFANPFGPMQLEEETRVIIDHMFEKMNSEDIFIGEVYTHLGLKDYSEKLKLAANSILDVINHG
ncbi:MAG: hypothetical protein WBO70_06670 [Erysipelotrichaceae bacterium]